MTNAIDIQFVTKTFNQTKALDKVSTQVHQGEFVALIGPRGSGKSTLLRHIAGLDLSDRLAESEIKVNGRVIQQNGRLTPAARYIRCGIGVISPQFKLIGRLSVLTNVLLGSLDTMPGWRGTLVLFSEQEKERALQTLCSVGLESQAYQRTSTLTEGQQQLVAIARTLMQKAKIILADEPVDSLDPQSAESVLQILRGLCINNGKTVIITLQKLEYAREYCKRALALVDGKVTFDANVKSLTDDVLQKLYGIHIHDEGRDDSLSIDSHNPAIFQIPEFSIARGITG